MSSNEASDGVSLREQLREMPFEFLHGVPVHLTDEMIDHILSLIHDHDQRIIAEAERRGANQAAFEFSGIILGHIEQLGKDYLGRGGVGADNYWRGFSDLAFGLSEFIGKELAAQTHAEIMRRRFERLEEKAAQQDGQGEGML